MNKATHDGHCQMCNRLHRAPNGRMAKHGYEVRFNFFVGTCPGSDNIPYERSCDLIMALLPNLRKQSAELAADAKKEARRVDGVWVHEYVPATWQTRRSSYVWVFVPLGDLEECGYNVSYIGKDSKKQRHATYASAWDDARNRERTPEEYRVAAIAAMNEKRAAAYLARKKQVDSYIAWCEKRIDDWKLADLIPRK